MSLIITALLQNKVILVERWFVQISKDAPEPILRFKAHDWLARLFSRRFSRECAALVYKASASGKIEIGAKMEKKKKALNNKKVREIDKGLLNDLIKTGPRGYRTDYEIGKFHYIIHNCLNKINFLDSTLIII